MGRTALGIGLACALLTACSSSSVDGYLLPEFKRGVAVGFTTEGPISNALAIEFGKRGYRVVERTRLETVIVEKALAQSRLLKEQQYVRAGQLLNVRYLISLNEVVLARNPNKPVSVTVKIVDIKDGAVVGAISYTNSSMGRTGSPFDEMHKKSSAAAAGEIADYIDEIAGKGPPSRPPVEEPRERSRDMDKPTTIPRNSA